MDHSLADRLQRTLGEGYRVTRELGGGGMSRVFVADETELGRTVVVKVLPPDLGAGLNIERFRREIQLAARLQHPHIVPLLSAGARDGLLFYTMPLIEGETLRARLARSGELPVADAVRILRDVADALEYAHRHGVVHRDIKPENVLLSGHHALVTDFGVSKALSSATGEQSLTSIGVALGTPAYMSPEQATADPNTDHRTDVYALGVLGYELLAGRPPFSGTTPQQTLAAHVTEMPELVTKHRPSISPALAQVVMRCIEKKPADRWQSADEVRVQLEALGTPSQGLPPVTGRLAAPAAAKSRKPVILAVVAAAALLFALLAGRYIGGARSGPEIVDARQITNDPGIEFTPALSPDGKLLAYAAGTAFTSEIFVRQLAGGQPVRLGQGRAPAWSPDGSRLVFASAAGIVTTPALGGPTRLLVRHHQGFSQSPAWSRDGQSLAWATSSGEIYVGGSDGSDPRAIVSGQEPSGLAWSPDDRRIAFVNGNLPFAWGFDQFANISPSSIWIINRDGSNAVQVTGDAHLNVSPVWSADGSALLYVSSSGGGRDIYFQRIGRNNRPDGSPQRLTTGLSVHGLTISADGTQLAYSNLTTSVGIWRMPVPASGTVSTSEAQQITSASERIEAVSVSPDGEWLSFDSDRAGNADIYRMRVDGTRLEQVTSDPADDFRPSWSPDGRLIAFHSWRGGDRDLFVIGADGSGERRVAGGPLHQWGGRFSPDGNEIVYFAQTAAGISVPMGNRGPGSSVSTQGQIQLFVVPTMGGVTRQVTSGERGGGPGILTNDGRIVFLATGGVEIINADGTGRRALQLPVMAARDRSVPFAATFAVELGGLSADGRSAYVRVASPVRQGMHIARIPLDGSAASIAVRFDQSDRQSLRPEFDTDGRTFYFTIGRHDADIWVVRLDER